MTWRHVQKKCLELIMSSHWIPALSRRSLCCPYPQVINRLITQASYTDSLLDFNVGSQFKCGCTGAALIKHLPALKQLCCITLTLDWRFKKSSIGQNPIYLYIHQKSKISLGWCRLSILVEIVTKDRSILYIRMRSGIHQRSCLMIKGLFYCELSNQPLSGYNGWIVMHY